MAERLSGYVSQRKGACVGPGVMDRGKGRSIPAEGSPVSKGKGLAGRPCGSLGKEVA